MYTVGQKTLNGTFYKDPLQPVTGAGYDCHKKALARHLR